MRTSGIEIGLAGKQLGACRLTASVALTTFFALWPIRAFGAFVPICEPNPFKGMVKTVTYEEGPVDMSTLQPLRSPRVRWTTHMTRDGRVATEISTDADSPRQAELKMFPTTIREYDGRGRMLSETLKLNGTTPFTTTTCDYDRQGRLVSAKMKSTNPNFNRTFTFAYSHLSRSQRFVTEVVSLLITVTLDDNGRPVKEVEIDELRPSHRRVSEYRYLAEATEYCSVSNEGGRTCRLTKYDMHGNLVEQQSEFGTSSILYEYDSAGNWIRRITHGQGRRMTGEWRRLTYW